MKNKNLKKSSIIFNIIVVILMSICFMCLISLISFYSMQKLNKNINSLYQQNLKSIIYVEEIRKNTLYIKSYISSVSNVKYTDKIDSMIFEKNIDTKKVIEQLKDDNTKQKILIDNFVDVYNKYIKAWEKSKVYLSLGNKLTTEDQKLFKEIDAQVFKSLDNLIQYNEQQFLETKEESKKIYISNIPIFVLSVIVPSVILIFYSKFLISSIRKSISEIFRVLSKLTNKNWECFEKRKYNNEFESMKNILSSTVIRQEDINKLELINNELRSTLENLKKTQEVLIYKEKFAFLGQFVGGIAHNLRTPLMAVSGNVKILKRLSKEYMDSIDDIDITKDDHKAIANDMDIWLDKISPLLSYMDEVIHFIINQTVEEREATSIKKFYISELIEQVNILINYELKKGNCTLSIKNILLHGMVILGNLNLLVQIINNLIINAIHSYNNKKGKIELFISSKDKTLLIEVKDYGCGIPEEIQKNLFNKMITTKGKAGIGLGLYISYCTIKANFEGDMWFKSSVGIGSSFFISIPI